jgi:hypothetical protein
MTRIGTMNLVANHLFDSAVDVTRRGSVLRANTLELHLSW